MKIFLFGDIASGKTTVSKKVVAQFPEFEIVAIDNFRRQFGDFTMKGENIALSEFLKTLKKDKNQIIEASGLGKLGKDIFDIISKFNDHILVVIFHISLNEINERIKNRNWDIPYPGKQERLIKIIQTINSEIKLGKIFMTWSTLPKTTILKIENNSIKEQSFISETIMNFIKLKSL